MNFVFCMNPFTFDKYIHIHKISLLRLDILCMTLTCDGLFIRCYLCKLSEQSLYLLLVHTPQELNWR